MAENAKWYVAHTYSGYENAVKTAIEKFVANRHLEDMIVDIQMGGISMRYQIDFALLIALASAVVMIDFLGKNEIGAGDRYAELFHRALILCTAFTVIWLLMTSMALEKQNPMLTYSTNLYYSLKYLIFVLR